MSVRLTSDLRAEGIGSNELRRKVRAQELHRVRRGAFSTDPQNGVQGHLQLIRATLPRLGDGAVLSHVSAAVLHQLPVDLRQLDRVTVTRPGKGGGWIGPCLHRYSTPLAADDVEVVNGLRRTIMTRTVVDLARSADLETGVAAADAALRLGCTPEQFADQLRRARRRRGLASARVALDFADGRSESAGESVSRVAIWRLGLPAPELQLEVEVDGHRYRSDFGWREERVLGEFDGKVKYGQGLRPGESAADVIMREKRREADLRAADWWVVRWTWADIFQPERLDRLLGAALRHRR